MKKSLLEFGEKRGFSEKKSNEKIVIVATPSYDGKVDAWYLDSLVQTIYLGIKNNVRVMPLIQPGEAILPMSRNSLLHSAYKTNIEALFFIDADQKWEAEAFFKLLNSKKQVIGLPVPFKTDNKNIFNVHFDYENEKRDGDYITVKWVGTGFMKIGKKALHDLCDSSEDINFKGNILKSVFEYGVINSQFVGEDYIFCDKVRELGYDLWIDRSNSSHHQGQKMYIGNFNEYEKSVKDSYFNQK